MEDIAEGELLRRVERVDWVWRLAVRLRVQGRYNDLNTG